MTSYSRRINVFLFLHFLALNSQILYSLPVPLSISLFHRPSPSPLFLFLPPSLSPSLLPAFPSFLSPSPPSLPLPFPSLFLSLPPIPLSRYLDYKEAEAEEREQILDQTEEESCSNTIYCALTNTHYKPKVSDR